MGENLDSEPRPSASVNKGALMTVDGSDNANGMPFDFDQWLVESRVAQAAVPILQRPDLLGAYDEWRVRYEAAKKASDLGERTLGEAGPHVALVEEGQQIIEDLQAAQTTWFVCALTVEDELAIQKACPLPKAPVRFERTVPSLPANPTNDQSQAFVAAWQAWNTARDVFQAQHQAEVEQFEAEFATAQSRRNAERVARAVVSIKQGGVVNRVALSGDQVLQAQKLIGMPQILKLISEIDRISVNAPEVPASFLSLT